MNHPNAQNSSPDTPPDDAPVGPGDPVPDPGARQVYGISDLATEFDVTHRAIRFYEDKGLLHPARKGQRRIYSPRDRVRLMLILRGKRLGFSLKDMQELLDLYDEEPSGEAQLRRLQITCRQRRAELEDRLKDIQQTLDELSALEAQSQEHLKRLGVESGMPEEQASGQHG